MVLNYSLVIYKLSSICNKKVAGILAGDSTTQTALIPDNNSEVVKIEINFSSSSSYLSIVTSLLDNLSTNNEPTIIAPCRIFDTVSIVPISVSNPIVGRLTVRVAIYSSTGMLYTW